MLFWIFACRNVDVVEGEPSYETPDAGPSEYAPPENVGSTDAEWELEAISNALSEVFSGIRTRHPSAVLDGYSMVMSHADSYCPQAYTVDGNSFWYGVCTSTSGMSYDGYLFYNTYDDYDLFGDGGLGCELLSGAAQMVDPDGD